MDRHNIPYHSPVSIKTNHPYSESKSYSSQDIDFSGIERSYQDEPEPLEQPDYDTKENNYEPNLFKGWLFNYGRYKDDDDDDKHLLQVKSTLNAASSSVRSANCSNIQPSSVWVT